MTKTVKAPAERLTHDPPRSSGHRGRLRIVLLPALSVLIIALVWEGLSALDPGFWPEIVLSRPTSIVPALLRAVTTPFVWENFWVTTQEALIGFSIGVSAGFLLGVLISVLRSVREALYPLIVFLESTPKIALAPVFIAWFGFGMTSKVALAAMICFFPLLVNTVTGMSMVDEHVMLLMRSLRASRAQVFFHLRLPSGLPSVFAGLKISVTLAVIGAVVGELTGANRGVAHLIKSASFQFRMEDVFAYVAMLGLLGLVLFKTAEFIERKLIFWLWGGHRTAAKCESPRRRLK